MEDQLPRRRDGNRSDRGAPRLHKGEGTRVRSGGETWRFHRPHMLGAMHEVAGSRRKVHLPPVLFQPMTADDVATELCKITLSAPVNGTVEIAGLAPFPLDELVRSRLAQLNDPREVITNQQARYAAAPLRTRILVPGKDARLAETSVETWLMRPAAKTAAVAN